MKVCWKSPDDATRLRSLVAGESHALRRDRYRVVLLAGAGDEDGRELYRTHIARRVGRSRQFVDEWVGRYRAGGIEALTPVKPKGAACKLSPDEQDQLRALLDCGPDPAEGIAAYNGPILKQKIEERFGKVYALSSVYAILHRLGYNDLMPRPRHPDTDPAAQAHFKKTSCPPRSSRSPLPTPANGS